MADASASVVRAPDDGPVAVRKSLAQGFDDDVSDDFFVGRWRRAANSIPRKLWDEERGMVFQGWDDLDGVRL